MLSWHKVHKLSNLPSVDNNAPFELGTRTRMHTRRNTHAHTHTHTHTHTQKQLIDRGTGPNLEALIFTPKDAAELPMPPYRDRPGPTWPRLGAKLDQRIHCYGIAILA